MEGVGAQMKERQERGARRTGWEAVDVEETGRELAVDVITVGRQEAATLTTGGKWVGLKREGRDRAAGQVRAKRRRRREEGALGNESKQEQKEEAEAGREMGTLEVAFLSFFQIAYF